MVVVEERPPHMTVKRFGCTTIHKKRYINASFIHSFIHDNLLDHCQVSSVPHYCGFKEQEIPGKYTVEMVIY